MLVHRLVARDTVEEGILALQERKRALADAALDDGALAAAMTRDDLLALLARRLSEARGKPLPYAPAMAHAPLPRGRARARAASSPGRERRLAIVLGLASAYLVAEVVGGLWTGSLALLADAGHMAADVAALALSLFASWLARRPAHSRPHLRLPARRDPRGARERLGARRGRRRHRHRGGEAARRAAPRSRAGRCSRSRPAASP